MLLASQPHMAASRSCSRTGRALTWKGERGVQGAAAAWQLPPALKLGCRMTSGKLRRGDSAGWEGGAA